MSVLTQFRWNSDKAVICRAALRGVASSLNMSLIALAAQELRRRRFGDSVEVVDAVGDHDLDQRNEIDHAVEGSEVESNIREEQGFAYQLKPLELAARLKLIRDACANEIDAHAGLRRNSLTGETFKNPYDTVGSIQESLEWLAKREANVQEAVVRNTAAVLQLDEQSVRNMLIEQHYKQQRFLKDNAQELIVIIQSLEAKGFDGHALGIDDDETVEERLPALNRAKLHVAADNALVNQRNKEVTSYMRGNPNAFGNIGMIDGERKLLKMKFDAFMKHEWVRDEINEAVSRGARYPKLKDLFPEIRKAA